MSCFEEDTSDALLNGLIVEKQAAVEWRLWLWKIMALQLDFQGRLEKKKEKDLSEICEVHNIYLICH